MNPNKYFRIHSNRLIFFVLYRTFLPNWTFRRWKEGKIKRATIVGQVSK